MHKFVMKDKPLGMTIGEMEAIKRIEKAKAQMEEFEKQTFFASNKDRKSPMKPLKLAVIGSRQTIENEFMNVPPPAVPQRHSNSRSISSRSSFRPNTSQLMPVLEPLVTPFSLSKSADELQGLEDLMRRMPEARYALSHLNEALDEMLDEIRVTVPKSAPKLDIFYDMSSSGLERSVDGQALDIMLAELSQQATNKVDRIRRFYHEHYRSLAMELQSKIQWMSEELKTKEEKIMSMQQAHEELKFIEEQRMEAFEDYMMKQGSSVLADLQSRNTDASHTIERLNRQMDGLLDKLERLRRENFELTAELLARREEEFLKKEEDDKRRSQSILDAQLADRENSEGAERGFKDHDGDEDTDEDTVGELNSGAKALPALSYRLQRIKNDILARKAAETLWRAQTQALLNQEEDRLSGRFTISRSFAHIDTSSEPEESQDPPPHPPLASADSQRHLHGPVKVSRTTYVLSPPTETMQAYGKCALQAEEALQSYQRAVVAWANNVLERAATNTNMFGPKTITCTSTSLCDGVCYGLIMKQLKQDSGSAWRDKVIDPILYNQPDLRCGRLLSLLPGIGPPLAKEIGHLTPGSSQAGLWHAIVLGYILQLSATAYSSDTRFASIFPTHPARPVSSFLHALLREQGERCNFTVEGGLGFLSGVLPEIYNDNVRPVLSLEADGSRDVSGDVSEVEDGDDFVADSGEISVTPMGSPKQKHGHSRKKRLNRKPRKPVTPEAGTDKPVESCMSLIVSIYESKLLKDEKELSEAKASGHAIDCFEDEHTKWLQLPNKKRLWDFSKDYAKMKYGIKKMADQKLTVLKVGCKNMYNDHVRIRVFGILAGIGPKTESLAAGDDVSVLTEGDSSTVTADANGDRFSLAKPYVGRGDDPWATAFALKFLGLVVPDKGLVTKMGQPSVHELLIPRSELERAVKTCFHLTWLNDRSARMEIEAGLERISSKSQQMTAADGKGHGASVQMASVDLGLELVVNLYATERYWAELHRKQTASMALQHMLMQYIADRFPSGINGKEQEAIHSLFGRFSASPETGISRDEFYTLVKFLDPKMVANQAKCDMLFECAMARQDTSVRLVSNTAAPLVKTTEVASEKTAPAPPTLPVKDSDSKTAQSRIPLMGLLAACKLLGLKKVKLSRWESEEEDESQSIATVVYPSTLPGGEQGDGGVEGVRHKVGISSLEEQGVSVVDGIEVAEVAAVEMEGSASESMAVSPAESVITSSDCHISSDISSSDIV